MTQLKCTSKLVQQSFRNDKCSSFKFQQSQKLYEVGDMNDVLTTTKVSKTDIFALISI